MTEAELDELIWALIEPQMLKWMRSLKHEAEAATETDRQVRE